MVALALLGNRRTALVGWRRGWRVRLFAVRERFGPGRHHFAITRLPGRRCA